MIHRKCLNSPMDQVLGSELHYVQVPFNIFTYLSSVKYVQSSQTKPRKLLPDHLTQSNPANISLSNLLLKVGLVTSMTFASMRKIRRNPRLSLVNWTLDLTFSLGGKNLHTALEIHFLLTKKCKRILLT